MNGLLVCAGEGKKKNIGDYIQSLAQEQYFDHIDCFVEREHMDTFVSNEKTNVVMNGWFMWHPENFPPSPSINPFFISFHIAPQKAEKMLTKEVISYLKRYEPIGARDISTKEILDKYGIKNYFSACLTLTLGKKYKVAEHDGKIVFVDPFCELGGRPDKSIAYRFARALFLSVKYMRQVRKLIIGSNYTSHINSRIGKFSKKIERWMLCASFYDMYSKIFSDEALYNAEYITHEVEQSDFKDDKDKLEYARELLIKYSKAKYVVTSRIHCALPCLGIETPVLFVTSDNLEKGRTRGAGRLRGIEDFFHIIRYTSNELVVESSELIKILGGGQDFFKFILHKQRQIQVICTESYRENHRICK